MSVPDANVGQAGRYSTDGNGVQNRCDESWHLSKQTAERLPNLRFIFDHPGARRMHLPTDHAACSIAEVKSSAPPRMSSQLRQLNDEAIRERAPLTSSIRRSDPAEAI